MRITEIKKLYESGLSAVKIAKMAGTNKERIYSVLRSLEVPRRKRGDYTTNYYVVYDARDNVITSGSSAECAAFLGIKTESFYCHACPSRDNPIKTKRQWYAIKVTEDDDDEGVI